MMDVRFSKLIFENLCDTCKFLTTIYNNISFPMKEFCPKKGVVIESGYWHCGYYRHSNDKEDIKC